jgi:hypothetical protein
MGVPLADTIMLFARGEGFEKNLLAGLIYSGKRFIKSTFPEKALHEFYLSGKRSASLGEVYINKNGDFFFTIRLEETVRKKDPITGESVGYSEFPYYEVTVSKKEICFVKIRDGQKVSEESECFRFKM